MISRESAAEIVDGYLKSGGSSWTAAGPGIGIEEKPGILSYWPYKVPLQECWIVYLVSPPGSWFGVRSSEVAVVRKETGEVLYVGSAGDEG